MKVQKKATSKLDKALIELDQPKFNKSRLRVYYGNIGEIITQEVLRKQGFEVWLPRPVADGRGYITIFRLPKMDEELKHIRKHYNNLPSSIREGRPWEQYREDHRERIRSLIESVKASRSFFGERLTAFKEYLKKLKRESIVYSCDLVAKKNHRIYVIEVKSTKGARRFLKGEKLRGLVLARKYGFIPALVAFNLKIEASNFKMIEI